MLPRRCYTSASPLNRLGIEILSLLLLAALPLASQEALPTVAAGTRLRVQFNSAVGTAISRQGDGVEVHLLKPVSAEGREVLPVGTILSGRVLAARKGDKHSHTYPMLRLGFNRVALPDGRRFSIEASLADLGVDEYVDSEGAASTKRPTKAGDIGVAAGTGAAGAGIGAIAGGGKGAGEGAAIGAGIGVLADLAAHAAQWYDFTLKKGRKAWLRLDQDLVLVPALPAAPKDSDPASAVSPSPVAQELLEPTPGENPETLPRHSAPTSQPLPSSPNHLNLPPQRPQLCSPHLVDSIKVLTLDTGPFAAAEVHRWVPSNKLQFVAVSVEYRSDCGFVCAPYTATLRTDSSTAYTPGVISAWQAGSEADQPNEIGNPPAADLHGQQGVREASYSAYDQVKTYFFTIARTDQPTVLSLDLSPDVRTLCHAQYSPIWQPSGTPEHVSLPLEGLPMRNNLVVVNQHSAPVRFGQLAVAVTAGATTNELGDRQNRGGPPHGHYFALVALGIRNVSSDPNCTDFDVGLLNDRGYKADYTPAHWTVGAEPRDLMPGETSGGTATFQVYQNTKPITVVLTRNIQAETFCAQKLNRPVDMHGGSMVRIPITGFPVASPPAQR